MRFLLLILLLSAVGPVLAADAADPVEPASPQPLWQHPDWLRLLHMERERGFGGWYWRSYTNDADFFLADGDAPDPQAELNATVQAFRAPADLGDEHAQCRFPARLHWLRQQQDLGPLPEPACAAWDHFRGLVQADRAVLIFPSYYLNSPSSMFGHTLLRLDRQQSDGGSEFLSFAVNFGAEVNPNDNGMFYAFKGLTGGYLGQFKIDHYYKKIQEYNRDENRDIWEYELNLSPAETAQLIRHVWELQGIDFSYYFFDENCSYRVLELLEVARPGSELTDGFEYTAIPIDTVRAAQRAGMVGDKQFRPAKGTVLKQRLDGIPKPLWREVTAVAADPEHLQSKVLSGLDRPTRARVIEAAYKYLRYTQTGQARDPTSAKRSFALLRQLRAHADALDAEAPQADPDTAPDRSHGSRRLSAGLWSEEDAEYLSLGLRLSLHSLIENRNGFLPGAQINLGNFEARLDEDGDIDLNRFDVIDIFSLSPRNRFFSPLSWSILTGIERQWAGGDEHRVAHVSGGVGQSRQFWPGGHVYALATLRVEHNAGYSDPLQPALGLRLGWLQYGPGVAWQLQLGSERFANGQTRWNARLAHNLRLARQHALHLEMNYRGQQPFDTVQAGLRYQFYF